MTTTLTRFVRWLVTLAHVIRVELGFHRCDLDGHVWDVRYVGFRVEASRKCLQVERVCQHCFHTELEWT